MVNLRPVLFVIGLVLSKLALFMYVPTLVAFFTGTGGFLDFAQYRSDHSSRRFYLFNDWSNRQIQTQRA